MKIEDYVKTGEYKACRKCKVKSTHHTICLSCLNILREYHEKNQDIWDVDPVRKEEHKAKEEQIAGMYAKGWTSREIALQVGIDRYTTNSILVKMFRAGMLDRKKHSKNKEMRCKISTCTT